MIGKKLSPILVEIENTLWESEANAGNKPEFTMDGFRAATKIFMAVMMDKIWELQSDETMDMEDRCRMVEKCGEEVRKVIKTFTNLDAHDFYSKEFELLCKG